MWVAGEVVTGVIDGARNSPLGETLIKYRQKHKPRSTQGCTEEPELNQSFPRRVSGCGYTSELCRIFDGFLAVLALSTLAIAQPKENSMTHHARGTFTVKMLPLTPAPAEGISRFSIDKEIHGRS